MEGEGTAMAEFAITMGALLIRVAIVGGVLLALPRITRKGLFLGVYVGEEFAAGGEARRLLRTWNRGCVSLMAVSLMVGIAMAVGGWPLAGNLTGTAVLLLGALGFYVRMHKATRVLAPAAASRQAARAAAPLQAGTPKGTVFAKITLGVCVIAGLVAFAYAGASYAMMPDRVPALADAYSAMSGESDKSIVTAMFFPSLNLLVSPFFALLALLTSGAKLSVRDDPGGRSLAAQESFRAANAILFGAVALLICALLTLVSVQVTRYQLSQTPSLGVAIWWVAGMFLLFSGASLFWLLSGYGQGGALIEGDSANRPLTNGLADNTHWVWGMFYVDRQDPSMMVEKRFGIGYTLNYGNRQAVLLVVTFVTLIAALSALGIVEIVF